MELASSHPTRWDRSRLDEALFDRLQISDTDRVLVPTKTKNSLISKEIVTENRCLYYLSGCYQRLLRQRVNSFISSSIRSDQVFSLGSF